MDSYGEITLMISRYDCNEMITWDPA